MTEVADDLHPLNDNREPDAEPLENEARTAVRDTMTLAGFHAINIGGGCRVWYRRADDGTHALVSYNNALDGDPNTKDWIVGQYGDHGGFVEVAGLSLERALEGANTLPSPVRPDGSLVEALYPSLQQALDDLG